MTLKCHFNFSPFHMNSLLPSDLRSEVKKVTKILRGFTEISSGNGPDKLIPATVIASAEGLAIISVVKAGFLITARGGSGIVIARLADRRWSAPSAIGIAGLGGGFEIGVEVSDLVIVLNHRRAVDAFTKGGNLTLGGNFTVAVGPMGRNVEADVTLRKMAAVYTYCKSRGLFAGLSLEGSYLIERKDTNRKFYSQDLRASGILNGDVEPPQECDNLYDILNSYTESNVTDWSSKNVTTKSSRPPSRPPAPTPQPAASTFQNQSDPEGEKQVAGAGETLVVTAVHAFDGQQPGDLSFQPGDRITIITKTDNQYDWWEGQVGGRKGIFPANYVTY
ncbi:SH3 domain-containing YSC84-like protein 1 isoform X4 [Phyllopteryx taeniolatus]|uniref:SH3 domain-containing YSC84-like protein 1 isoform X4 n=1 Tax=Phyllopteryx taeniolatus TaxID=161469 RepID=UPI002AD4A54C|nr:SH3 domain-containing YSC84-like protein 1 isoform X4 [Phyllopteryx taeniolatus]